MHKKHFVIGICDVVLEMTPQPDLFQVLVDDALVGQVLLTKEHSHSRWYCQQCSSHPFVDKDHVLQHVVTVHGHVPHPLGVRPALSNSPALLSLVYAGRHPDPTYDEVCYRLHLVG